MVPVEDFAWVKERRECSLAGVFKLLRKQVMEDVVVRQNMRPSTIELGIVGRGEGFLHSFKFSDGSNNFTVSLEGRGFDERVLFLLEPDSIKATGTNGETIVEGKPSLNAEGKCILKINSKEYPLWYFRKLALEKLFFDSGADLRP